MAVRVLVDLLHPERYTTMQEVSAAGAVVAAHVAYTATKHFLHYSLDAENDIRREVIELTIENLCIGLVFFKSLRVLRLILTENHRARCVCHPLRKRFHRMQTPQRSAGN